MRTSRLTALMLLGLAAAGTLPAAHAATPTCAEEATGMLDAMGKADYDAARKNMDGFMLMMFSADSLKANWAALTDKYGAYRSHGTADASVGKDGSSTVKIPLDFANGHPTAVILCSPADEHGTKLGSLAVI